MNFFKVMIHVSITITFTSTTKCEKKRDSTRAQVHKLQKCCNARRQSNNNWYSETRSRDAQEEWKEMSVRLITQTVLRE